LHRLAGEEAFEPVGPATNAILRGFKELLLS